MSIDYAYDKLHTGLVQLASEPGRIRERLEYAVAHSLLKVSADSLPDFWRDRFQAVIKELTSKGTVETSIRAMDESRASEIVKEIVEIYDAVGDASRESLKGANP